MLDEKYELLSEGINDVGIFKAVFMAGGPGSGKSFVARKLGLKALGLRPVNSDDFFEQGLKKANLSLKMPESEEEKREIVRQHAKSLTAKKQNLYVKGRLGLIIDSTARDIKKITEQNKLLKQLGYETTMVFVNTTLETALDRNRSRARSIPEKIVRENHETVRKNIGKLQGNFGAGGFIVVDNDGDAKDLEKATRKIYPKLRKFTSKLPDNKMVKAWTSALTMKPKDTIEPEQDFERGKWANIAAGDQPVKGREKLKTFREQQELLEVQKKEVDAMKKLSKDMQGVLKGYLKIVKMGDRELMDAKHNPTYKQLVDARDKIITMIGTLNNKMRMEEIIPSLNEVSFDSLSPAQKVQMYKLLSKGMDLPYGSPAFKKNKAEIDKLRKKLKLDEGENSDRVKEKQEREKEALASRHADEMDDAKEKDFKDAQDDNKRERQRDEASAEVMKTKEKIYKDLKKKRGYFEKEYGKDRADDIMHGTAMNQAKKHHEIAEAYYETELSRQLALEFFTMQQRRAIGMRMKRQAKKIAKARLRAKKRMAPVKQLMKRAMKSARDTLAKKMSGGKGFSQMSMGQKIAISKKLDKQQGKIQKMAKKKLPMIKKDEVKRLKAFKSKLADKSL